MSPICRRTLVVSGRLQWRIERVRAAREKSSGLQILTPSGLAERLAGGFLREIPTDALHETVAGALAEGGFKEIGDIAELPGMVRAVSSSLRKAWAAGLNLQGLAKKHARIADMALLESRIRKNLPSGTLLPADLIAAALKRIEHAPKILGAVEVRGIPDIAPCWRPVIAALAEKVELTWHRTAGPEEDLKWLKDAGAKLTTPATANPKSSAVLCANPRHEALEALRWARQLIASGQAAPSDIAIAAASTEDWDDYIRTLSAEANFPVHFPHGIPALSGYAGQAAAALAEVLLHGLGQSRIVRLFGMCRQSKALEKLPDGWQKALPKDAALLTPEQWQRALSSAPADQSEHTGHSDIQPVVMPIIELLAKGPDAAHDAGEKLLTGMALDIWQRALRTGPPEAVATALREIKVDDGKDPAACVVWTSARNLVSCPRRFVRLIGLTSRGWPRSGGEDPLLPDHLLPSGPLIPVPVSVQDRMDFQRILAATAVEIVLSRSRRDREGRLLGPSPLFPAAGVVSLNRSRIPDHAATESDRLLARPAEFSKTARAKSAAECWRDWHRPSVTAHDGLIRAGQLDAALSRTFSASSLKKLLRDPLGFVWRYALGWDEPAELEEPLILDAAEFGSLVHEILERAVQALEKKGGFAAAGAKAIRDAVSRASKETAAVWEIERPLPPALIWKAQLQEAEGMSVAALTAGDLPLDGQRSWVELPFGRRDAESPDGTPWDPRESVVIPNLGISITGIIDRLDIDGAGRRARVTDYKTGAAPGENAEFSLKGGEELQRCLYTLAVRTLMPKVTETEARLHYPAAGRVFTLDNSEGSIATLLKYIDIALKNMRRGTAVPGDDSEGDFNDLLFALPANSGGTYFPRKRDAFTTAMGTLPELWKEP